MADIVELVTDALKVSDYTVGITYREGKVVGFAESRRLDGRAADVALTPDGAVVYHFHGKPFQNEQDTLVPCRVLVSLLNDQGSDWGEPVKVDEPATDVVCQPRSGMGRRLAIQVVRSQVDRLFWKEASEGVADSRPAGRSADLAAVVDEVRDAIEHKCANINAGKRREILLLLNAIDCPAHVLDDVITSFKDRFGEWVEGLGFDGIWIVGPCEMAHQLAAGHCTSHGCER